LNIQRPVVRLTAAPRDWKQALGRGVRGKCPACGEGRLFASFLRPVDRCAACGEDLTAQRADDFPPYIVILLLGHILVPLIWTVDHAFRPPMWAYMIFGSALVIALALLLLPRVKGAVIGYQWALRMGDFDAG
jgi:uncharacterized protein (DUF983 family)